MSDITVISRTQKIILDPATHSVSVINIGPMGPTGLTGPSEAATILTTNGDILTRAAGVLAKITRANLAIDTAFTSQYPNVVNHGATAGTARLGTAPCLWIGSVNPTNATNNDQLYRTDQTALYIRVSGAWVEVGSSRYAPIKVSGTYTPNLGTPWAIGTGGSPLNTADWTYDGDRLFVHGQIKFGTSGATAPASPATVSLPAGYTMTAPVVTNTHPISQVTFIQAAGGYFHGAMRFNSTTTLTLLAWNANATYLGLSALSASVPFSWVAGDMFDYWYLVKATGP